MKIKPPNRILTILAFSFLSVAMFACSSLSGGDAHAIRGMKAYHNDDYHKAIDELQQAIEAGDITQYELEEVYSTLGNAYYELDRYDEAIAAHEKAISINPDYYKAYVNLGITYRNKGDLARAEEYYTKALSLEPNYAELHASIGVLYIIKGEPAKAVESLERAIELDAKLAGAHGNLALAYAMVGRFDEAEASLRQATSLGYKNSAEVQERINNLKALEGG